MVFFSSTLGRILSKVPGEKRLGVYRFLPVFFVIGGAMEWIMINMRVDDVYRRKQSERRYQQRLAETSQSSGSD
ncbi:unnamed protein product [Lampetra planeri]